MFQKKAVVTEKDNKKMMAKKEEGWRYQGKAYCCA